MSSDFIQSLDDLYILSRALKDPGVYPHEVNEDELEIVETFHSLVILTGVLAYKIKKPQAKGPVDFSILEQRYHYCREEVRLTRRFAPDFYQSVVPITGSIEDPIVEGTDTPFEYAIRMKQFPGRARLDRVLERNERSGFEIEQLGRSIARFHERVESAWPGTKFGHPDQIRTQYRHALQQIREHMADPPASLKTIESWLETRHHQLEDRFRERRKQGYILDAHGDLHVKNIARMDDSFLTFDVLEYEEQKRWIDPMREVALLFIDLLRWERFDLSWAFLNEYLDWTGDYDGLDLFRYYAVFRGVEREGILNHRRKAHPDGPDGFPDDAGYREGKFLETIHPLTQPEPPELIILHGLPGTGKSTMTRHLVKALGGIHITADVERKRLHGLDPLDPSGHELDAERLQGIYSPSSSERTYTRLRNLASRILKNGFRVILDATFLKRRHRDRMRDVANRYDVPFHILNVYVREEELLRRLRQRSERMEHSRSEADETVLEHELKSVEPLEEDERRDVTSINLEQPFSNILETVSELLDEEETHLPPGRDL